MKEIKICIGSACHLKGSYDVIEAFQELIKEFKLDEKITLSAAFCLGHCTEAVSVKRWDETLLAVSKDNARDVFENEIIPLL